MDILESLEATRADYEEEQQWHLLLLDAYSGGGGFSGSVVQSQAGYWGHAAQAYSGSTFDETKGHKTTYLDRHPREDDPKFRSRIEVSHYPNYIQPLTDLKVSFMLAKELMVDNRPQALIDWREDVDGNGTTWDEVREELVLRSSTVGWIPVVVDMPRAPVDGDGNVVQLNRAQADALGLRPRVVPLFPANLVDYQADDTGAFDWAKIRTDHVEKPDPFSEAVKVTRYTIWFPNHFEQYEVIDTDGKKTVTQVTPDGGERHEFGEVPIAILRAKAALDDSVKGLPMHGQESIEARRLFNVHSELDEHIRGQVFAVLVLAMEENEEGGDIVVGPENGLYLDPNSTQKHYYMSPSGDIAGALETRIENIIQEIYRQARVEFSRPTSARSPISGIARKFEFAQTNAALKTLAQNLARFEEHIDALVGTALGVSADILQAETITAHTSFDVEDLQESLQVAMDAITGLQVGPTASKMLRQRVIEQLLPNRNDQDVALIDSELDEMEKEAAVQRQLNAELAASLSGEEEEEEPPEDEEAA